METMVYRKTEWPTGGGGPTIADNGSRTGMTETSGPDNTASLPPEIFYPVVTEEEHTMWEHWLPTSIVLSHTSHYAISKELERLQAPQSVMDEYQWSRDVEMFDEYEIRSPERKDARDPLFLGRSEGKRHRIALWGESLLPLAEIARLVQESLVVKARVAKRQLIIGLSGTIPAALLALYSLYMLAWQNDSFGAAGILLALMVWGFSWAPSAIYTPENAQHDFLDHYRL